MANSIGRALSRYEEEQGTPRSTPFHNPVAATQEERVAIMAARYARGNNIWDDTPLSGQARDEWEGKRIPDEFDSEDDE
jgi:hypothetical protein